MTKFKTLKTITSASLILAGLGISFLTTTGVNAQTTSSNSSSIACSKADEKRTQQISNLKDRETKRQAQIQKISDNINKLITKAQSKNVDPSLITNLQNDLKELNNRSQTLQTDLTNLSAQLDKIKTAPCNSDERKADVTQAKSLRDTLKTDRSSFTDYLKSTFKPAVAAVRDGMIKTTKA